MDLEKMINEEKSCIKFLTKRVIELAIEGNIELAQSRIYDIVKSYRSLEKLENLKEKVKQNEKDLG